MNTTARTLCIVHCALCIAAASAALAATPEVTSVTMAQSAQTREVTITYTMDNAPAVVTLDIQTNATVNGETVWTSIGGEHIWNATGDVWKKVDAASGTISWHPDLSWPDHRIAAGGARAVVTAWALDNTPDYMVVDIMNDGKAATQDARCTYYPAVDFLPGSELGQTGAITNNPAYKQGYVVMRKIMAKGVTWQMGSIGEGSVPNSKLHEAQLTNNYYIGVFEITQGQLANIVTKKSLFTAEGVGRPFDSGAEGDSSYITIRLANQGSGDPVAGYEWPNAPHSGSKLGKLRTRTGVDFDLPSDAEWEFACRAGHGSGYFGDGSVVSAENLNRLARCAGTVTVPYTEVTASTPPSEGGTAIVGSYAPNDWGLYDMYGNVAEWCLDRYYSDVSSYGGKVAITASSSAGTTRVIRGGAFCSSHDGTTGWNDQTARFWCMSGARYGAAQAWAWTQLRGTVGFRVACRAGLK